MSLLFLLLIPTIPLLAQTESISQLEKQLQMLSIQSGYQADTARCRVLNQLGDELRNIDSDRSYQYTLQAFPIAEKYQLKREISRYHRLRGIHYMRKGDYGEALQNYQKGLEIAEEIQFLQEIGGNMINMGIIYIIQSDYPKALGYLQKSLEVLEKTGDRQKIANTLNNIGVIYRNQGKAYDALRYYQESLEILTEMGDKQGMASNLNNMGTIYSDQGNYPKALEYYNKSVELGTNENMATSLNNIGTVYALLNNNAKALEYYLRGLEIREKSGEKSGISMSLNNIGSAYTNLNNNAKALEYYRKSLEISEKTGDKKGVATALNNIGKMYIKQECYQEALPVLLESKKISEDIGNKALSTYPLNALAILYQKQTQYAESISYAKQSLSLALEIKMPLAAKNAYEILYQTSKLQKDYESALIYFEQYKDLNDSLFNIEKSRIVASLENQAELEKKEKEISILAIDKELGRVLAESQSRRLAISQKQAEANHLLALARQEKDQRKADSLHNLAQKAQLEADNLRINEEKINAENKISAVLIEKARQEAVLQQWIIYLVTAGLLSMLAFSFFIYRSLMRETKAKKLLAIKNKEIESLNDNLEITVKKRTKTLEYYAFFNSHKLRAPVARLLGLFNLYQNEHDEHQKEIIFDYFNKTVKELDAFVNEIQDIVKEETNQ